MTHPTTLNRRGVLALMAAGLTLPLVRPASAQKVETLALFGPPAGPSVTLAHAVATGGFSGIAGNASMTAWRNPDELRAGLTSGRIGLSVVPIQAAANLYNRGFPIKLANAMTNGLLYIISEAEGIAGVPDLAGRRMAVPYRGDTPEIIFSQLLVHHGLNPEIDLDIVYAGSPTEAMQMLLAGQVDAALTAEPSTTAGVLNGKKAGKQIKRVLNIQTEFGVVSASTPVVPQAGLAITQAFLEENGGIVPAILSIIEASTVDVLANPEDAAANASDALGMPAQLLAASIPHSNLVARPAREARSDIERMLTAMAGPGFERIGGKLPDDAFYL